jgi:DMSO/TMAO reductase YedYZ molybdopterin-dependent catalytic subunit
VYLLMALLLAATPGLAAPAGDSLVIEVAGHVTVMKQADLMRLPRDTVTWSHHGTPHTYVGVRVTDLLRRLGVPVDTLRRADMTKRLVVEAADGYRAVFTLAEMAPGLGEREVLLVDREDGQPLPPEVGPLRLVVPQDGSGARSVWHVIALRVRDEP